MTSVRKSNSKRFSITARLTVLYALAAFIILSISCTYLYLELGEKLDRQNRHYLRDEVNLLRGLLHEDPVGFSRLTQEIELEHNSLEIIRHYVRLLDKEGNVLVSTPGMAEHLPVKVFPQLRSGDKRYGEKIKWRDPGGPSYLLKTVQVSSGHHLPRRFLHVALDISHVDVILDHHRRNLIVVLLFGVSISSFAGLVVARQGMEPLKAITRATQSISANRLDERIGNSPWPKELVSLANAFDHMLERLEDSFGRLSHCAGDLAHELRTPIGNLMGEAEVALAKKRESADYCRVLASSLEEYDRLSRMIDKILFLARADSRSEVISPSRFEIADAIEEVKEFHTSLAEEQGVSLMCRGNAIVYADRTLLQRVIANLLTNALRHTPAGGEVQLIITHLKDDSVTVGVADTGCGIAPVHLPRIFDRFYRVDTVRSGAEKGSGLGLAMVKSIMDLHGGSVRIESHPGWGTVATVVFPPPSEM